jgi:hypothetical protein
MPFTIDEFMNVFKLYNQAVWPVQIFLNILALGAIFYAFKIYSHGDKLISGILGFFWLWIGLVYHIGYFSSINTAAYIFGILFIIQGLLFITSGSVKNNLSFNFPNNTYGYTGALFTIYALIIYPILGYNLGHIYPQSPTFGLPCPTTIFTFGLLLWTDKRIPKYVLIIPVLWALIGFSAAINLQVYEDFGLAIAGIVGLIMLLLRDRKKSTT